MKTSELIKQRRKELQLTLKDVANSVGVSEATVSRWESGNIANMGRDKIAALAKVLRISPSVIAGYKDINNNSLPLSPHEQNVIIAYRSQPEMQPAVDRLLNVPSEDDNDIIAADMAKTLKAAEKLGTPCPKKK